jgi:dipeptide/tripeptide permease
LPFIFNILRSFFNKLQDALSEKFRNKTTDSKKHWLDYAEEKHGVKLVSETKTVINILKLYIPLPIYWAVYMMQGSRWIFQATRMNNDLGFYTIPADQIYTLNPFFVILTLPLCDYVLYPLLEKTNLGSLLQKMTIGGLLGVVSVSIAAFIEKTIETDKISILWLVPQYLIFAISDNFIFISHMRFVYTEASTNMKSVMTSSVYVVMASGDLIVIFVSGLKLFDSQLIEFLFFSGILLAAMILFGFLAARYKPVDKDVGKGVENGEKETLMMEKVNENENDD